MLIDKKIFYISLILITTNFPFVLHAASSLTPQSSTLILHTSINANNLIIPVEINGHTYHFLLDTGVSHSVIDNQLASTITQLANEQDISYSFKTATEQNITTPHGLLSKDKVNLWQSLPIQIGHYTLTDSDPWLGIDTIQLSQIVGQQIDGLLGISVFRRLNWEVNNQTKTLDIFLDPPTYHPDYQHCAPYNDSTNKSPEFALDFKEGWALFRMDTGANYTLFSADILEGLRNAGADIQQSKIQEKSISVKGTYSTTSFLVDGLLFEHIPVGKLLVTQNESGLNHLGMNFLDRFDRYLFIPSKMLLCFNIKQTNYDEQLPTRHIALRRYQDYIEVMDNYPKEGLYLGDRLLRLNGQTLNALKINTVRKTLNNARPSSLKLTIERKGNQLTITL